MMLKILVLLELAINALERW